MFIWITACTTFTYTINARRPCAAIPSIRKARRSWMKMDLLSLCGVVSRKFMHIYGRTYQGNGKSMRKGHKEREEKSEFYSFQIHEKKRNGVSLLMLRFFFHADHDPKTALQYSNSKGSGKKTRPQWRNRNCQKSSSLIRYNRTEATALRSMCGTA